MDLTTDEQSDGIRLPGSSSVLPVAEGPGASLLLLDLSYSWPDIANILVL